ncbi:MAG: glutathione S-transferase N-terminal domain-containing protein [Betaproteobacteria bacterium]
MIEFYTAQTSNGQRAAIMLEECGLAYRVHAFDLFKGEQKNAEFLKVNPAGQIPAIVDAEGPGGQPLVLAQSAAILLYLAEKTGRFLPLDPRRRAMAYQWLQLAMTDAGPASGSVFLLSRITPEKSAANVTFFEERLVRFLRLADARLAQLEYLADELSIADFALYPIYAARKSLVDAAGDLPQLTRWGAALAARSALSRAMQLV